SSADACSSKSNDRQNRLRMAKPQARLIRVPNGAWTTNCMPPDSSKKRSNNIRFCVGTIATAACSAATYVSNCSAALCDIEQSAMSFSTTSSSCGGASSSRNRPTSSENSRVRPGASPNQNGTVGGEP